MLNDPMDPSVKRSPALPESLQQAVRGAEATGRAAEERAHLAMPFRARLRARDAVRPQPTLSILTHAAPVASPPAVMRLPPQPVPAPAPVRAPAPAAGEVRALKREPPPPPAKPKRESTVIPAAVTGGAIAAVPRAGANGSGSRRGDDEDDARGWKLSEFSQFAFAGLAVLGLAGLSVMAADNALNGGKDKADGEADTLTADSFPATDVSIAALGDAAAAAPTPWFDYKGTADLLKARVAELQAQEQEAARLTQTEADREAALAIANAEAARAAAEQPAAAAGPTVIDARLRDRLATEEAMRQADADAAARLQAEQEAIVLKAEADRIAAEEAARAAAAQAEAKRLADLEATRAAEAEAQRLAELEARKQAAEVEAQRLADLQAKQAAEAAEAKRLADLEARRAAEVEAKRLADLEAKRLADLQAKQKADADAALLASAAAVQAPEPKRLSVPPAGAPSLKPPRPAQEPALAEAGSPTLLAATPSVRTPPPALSAPAPEVRPLALPRPVDDFIAERAEYTAGRELDVAALAVLKSDFLALVEASPDGTHHELTTPDGRPLLIHFERTVPVDPLKASISAIGYAPSAGGAVTRAYLQPVSVNVHVMCRDVAYAFPGQERGRFAACQGDDGTWRMARATNISANPI